MRNIAPDAGPKNGIDTMVRGIFSNFFKDPVLDKPEFLAVRQEFAAAVRED